jgi:hypothetical protein
MRLILFFLITSMVFTSQAIQAQNYSVDDFIEVPVPAPYSKLWYEWNGKDDQSIHVSFANGKLLLKKQERNSSIVTKESKDGTLIGVDNGEFGGGLYYKPNDTTKKYIEVNGSIKQAKDDAFGEHLYSLERPSRENITGKIPVKYGNIQDIFFFNEKLFSLEGLAHLGTSEGAIYELDVAKDKISYKEVLRLTDAPMAYALNDGAIYLATFERFYIIRNLKLKLIADKLFWQSLYPNSVAVKDSKHIYVGMRAGYAIINTHNRKIVFYRLKGLK